MFERKLEKSKSSVEIKIIARIGGTELNDAKKWKT